MRRNVFQLALIASCVLVSAPADARDASQCSDILSMPVHDLLEQEGEEKALSTLATGMCKSSSAQMGAGAHVVVKGVPIKLNYNQQEQKAFCEDVNKKQFSSAWSRLMTLTVNGPAQANVVSAWSQCMSEKGQYKNMAPITWRPAVPTMEVGDEIPITVQTAPGVNAKIGYAFASGNVSCQVTDAKFKKKFKITPGGAVFNCKRLKGGSAFVTVQVKNAAGRKDVMGVRTLRLPDTPTVITSCRIPTPADLTGSTTQGQVLATNLFCTGSPPKKDKEPKATVDLHGLRVKMKVREHAGGHNHHLQLRMCGETIANVHRPGGGDGQPGTYRTLPPVSGAVRCPVNEDGSVRVKLKVQTAQQGNLGTVQIKLEGGSVTVRRNY